MASNATNSFMNGKRDREEGNSLILPAKKNRILVAPSRNADAAKWREQMEKRSMRTERMQTKQPEASPGLGISKIPTLEIGGLKVFKSRTLGDRLVSLNHQQTSACEEVRSFNENSAVKIMNDGEEIAALYKEAGPKSANKLTRKATIGNKPFVIGSKAPEAPPILPEEVHLNSPLSTGKGTSDGIRTSLASALNHNAADTKRESSTPARDHMKLRASASGPQDEQGPKVATDASLLAQVWEKALDPKAAASDSPQPATINHKQESSMVSDVSQNSKGPDKELSPQPTIKQPGLQVANAQQAAKDRVPTTTDQNDPSLPEVVTKEVSPLVTTIKGSVQNDSSDDYLQAMRGGQKPNTDSDRNDQDQNQASRRTKVESQLFDRPMPDADIVENDSFSVSLCGRMGRAFKGMLPSLTSCIFGYLVLDWIGQELLTISSYDWQQTINMFLLGLCHGVVGHFFYKHLDAEIEGTKLVAVAFKLVLEQVLWYPLLLHVGTALHLGQPNSVLQHSMPHHENMLQLLLLVSRFFNFKFVPSKHRLLFVQTCHVGLLLCIVLLKQVCMGPVFLIAAQD